MLGLVQNWFGPRCNPIGVDFGSDCLRLAQVQWVENDWRLLAAASENVPKAAREDPAARAAFFTQSMRDLLLTGGFHGRAVVLGLPASGTYIQHIRMARLDEEETKKALRWEARGKLPIDPSGAVLRHIIAGEVYTDAEPRNEVIVFAARNETVADMLASAAKARLDVVGMNVEPVAILDCFTQVYRRKQDAKLTNFFIDIGLTGTRAMLASGTQMLFARAIPIGGNEFNAAVAEELKMTVDQARVARIKAAQSSHSQSPNDRTALTPEAPAPVALHEQVDAACQKPLAKLADELNLCRRYNEATFSSKPVDRLVFIGGESRHRSICMSIARKLGLAAQLGDPLCRMAKWSDIGIASGIDRRLPQPAWAVAIGLSMGQRSGTAASAPATAGEARSHDERA